jgi:GxxExxY protein
LLTNDDGDAFARVESMLRAPGQLKALTRRIIGCGLAVHRAFGPGLLESIYKSCFKIELKASGLSFESERAVPIVYRGEQVCAAYRIDLIVENSVVVEIKAVQALAPVHSAQLITYLKLTSCPVGLLMNFNVPLLTHGVRRLVHPSPRLEISTANNAQADAMSSSSGDVH